MRIAGFASTESKNQVPPTTPQQTPRVPVQHPQAEASVHFIPQAPRIRAGLPSSNFPVVPMAPMDPATAISSSVAIKQRPGGRRNSFVANDSWSSSSISKSRIKSRIPTTSTPTFTGSSTAGLSHAPHIPLASRYPAAKYHNVASPQVVNPGESWASSTPGVVPSPPPTPWTYTHSSASQAQHRHEPPLHPPEPMSWPTSSPDPSAATYHVPTFLQRLLLPGTLFPRNQTLKKSLNSLEICYLGRFTCIMLLETAIEGIVDIQDFETHVTMPPQYKKLKDTWEAFIDSVMRE
ncbi:hypothetical protein CPB83DRAFT_895397 [Crepidotus variabilis]|uniref:Uncharacterized protein n=1 Tax=Crepidotus variabilis TaxID=179855 RepID=A0A9P6EE56_9AGAR|nr:hypothetical protein CPB83DRAFT_895397 [Crepidotus variabilis]